MRRKGADIHFPISLEPRKNIIIGIGLFTFVFLLYSLFLTHTSYFTRDPVHYALRLERGTSPHFFFEANHLLYSPLGYTVFALWRWFGWDRGIMLPLQLLSAFAGALGASLFFWLIMRVTQDTKVSLLASGILVFSYGYWRYALEATAYPLTSLCMIGFLLVATSMHSRLSAGLAGLLGLVNGLVILFLQSGVLLVPFVLASFALTESAWAEKVKKAGIYLGSLISVAGIPYAVVVLFALKLRTVDELLTYLLKDVGTTASWYGFGNLSFMTPLKAIIGFGNLWVGEVFALDFIASHPSLRSVMSARMPDVSLPPAFWVNNNPLCFVVFSLLACVVVAILILFSGYLIRYWKGLWHRYNKLLAICLVWIIPFAALGLYLRPETVHVWLPILVPVCLILALVLQDARHNQALCRYLTPRGQQIVAVSFLVALFSLNFFGSILPAHDPDSNWTLRMSSLLKDWAGEDDLVICLEAGEFKHLPPHVMYYVGSQVLPVAGWFLGRYPADYIDGEIQQRLSSGARVLVVADVFDSEAGYAHIARASGMTVDEIRKRITAFFARYEMTVVIREGDQPLVYEITALK